MKPASPSVLIISGETSGERYAAQVVESFRELEPGSPVQFYGSGGEAMRRAGVELLADVEHLSAIGPWEAVKSLAHYLRLRREALAEVRRRGTRLALLVDFPDFNLLLARQLRRMGVTVLYYISPTVWAWRAGRVRTIRRTVRKMLCIFPFEEPIYRRAGVDVRYVGHPLTANLPRVDPPAEFRRRFGLAETDVPLSVLPGSRRAEIAHIFPTILAALPAIKAAVPGARFLLPAASAGARQAIEAQLDRYFAAPPPPRAPGAQIGHLHLRGGPGRHPVREGVPDQPLDVAAGPLGARHPPLLHRQPDRRPGSGPRADAGATDRPAVGGHLSQHFFQPRHL